MKPATVHVLHNTDNRDPRIAFVWTAEDKTLSHRVAAWPITLGKGRVDNGRQRRSLVISIIEKAPVLYLDVHRPKKARRHGVDGCLNLLCRWKRWTIF